MCKTRRHPVAQAKASKKLPISFKQSIVASNTSMKSAIVILLGALFAIQVGAIPLAEYTKTHSLKLFVATKGAEMPNSTDQTNTLQEGDQALLMSSQGITDLTGISKLVVINEGKEVPITSVKHLHLFFNNNGIKELPEEFKDMKNVEWLYFEHNHLKSLPRGLTKMESLLGMFYTDNEFAEIPALVFEMKQLRKLQFSKNKVTVLPEAIGKLNQLRHLNISDNQIVSIPESISKLSKLRVCDLSDNSFTSLPDAFGKVQIVNQLRVRNCPITTLPSGFAAMRGTIDITGTKIDADKLPPDLRAKINTEKPPGSKDPEKLVVKKKAKKN
jgi:Leucine-rich repeat (LRR) protein